MSTTPRTLSDLPNLGVTIVAQLRDAGIDSVRVLTRIGAAVAYRRLCARAGRRLPKCYYLYSLEGALQGRRWSSLSADEKLRLDLAVREPSAARPQQSRVSRRRA